MFKAENMNPKDLKSLIMKSGPQMDCGEPFILASEPRYLIDHDLWEVWIGRNEYPQSINFLPNHWNFQFYPEDFQSSIILSKRFEYIFRTVLGIK